MEISAFFCHSDFTWNHFWSFSNYFDNNTDLGIHNVKFSWFFLPYRFYVTSIWVILKLQKLSLLPFQQLWILTFWKFLTLQSVKLPKNQNSKLPKWLKWQILTFCYQPKMISRKIWVAENPEISTLCLWRRWERRLPSSFFYRKKKSTNFEKKNHSGKVWLQRIRPWTKNVYFLAPLQ